MIANTRRLAAINDSKQKTDRHDARTLAQLLAAGMLESSWLPDEDTRALRRRVARRAKLVVHRTRYKNEILAVLHRNLTARPPMTDAFVVAGRRWLGALVLPGDERDTINAALRQIDFLSQEITVIERDLATFVLGSPHAKRLMTVPGVGMITAAVFLAYAGDISRFPTAAGSWATSAWTPRSANPATALHAPAASAKKAPRSCATSSSRPRTPPCAAPEGLRGFYERVRARRGHQIAIVAVARKMCVLFWHLLTTGRDYAYSLPTATAKKMRAVELKAGATPPQARRATSAA